MEEVNLEIEGKISQEDIDEILDNQRITKLQLQMITDMLEGGVKSYNMIENRNTVVFNDWGDLDATYPFVMDFELPEDMTKLVECKVTFKMRNFNIGVKDI